MSGDRLAAHRFDNALRRRPADAPEQTQFTPEYVLGPVRRAFGGTIWLDPCTTNDNPVGARAYLTAEQDGLARSWWGESVFVNPPYGEARIPWVERCIEAGERGQKVVLLIPAATDTRIFQKAAASAQAIVFTKGRVKFGVRRPNGRQVAASHPSALLCWNVDVDALQPLGVVLARLDSGAAEEDA